MTDILKENPLLVKTYLEPQNLTYFNQLEKNFKGEKRISFMLRVTNCFTNKEVPESYGRSIESNCKLENLE